jgi:hypothetical protein
MSDCAVSVCFTAASASGRKFIKLTLQHQAAGVMCFWADANLALLGYLFARSAELGGKILKLRQPILHRQDGLSIVDVNAWAKF